MRVEELARPGGPLGRVCPLLWRDRDNDRTRIHPRLDTGRVGLPEELRRLARLDTLKTIPME